MFILSQQGQIKLNYLKTHNKFCADISKGLSSKEMISFSDIEENQDVDESIHKKQKKKSNQKEYDSVEDPLSMRYNK